MNIINALFDLFHPGRAARLDAMQTIAFAAGSEQAPLARLLRQVQNAERTSGLRLGGGHADALRQHVEGAHPMQADRIVDTVAALKRQNRATLETLMRNSAGTRPGSAHANQIRATQQLIGAARQFPQDVRTAAAKPGRELAAALVGIGNPVKPGQGR